MARARARTRTRTRTRTLTLTLTLTLTRGLTPTQIQTRCVNGTCYCLPGFLGLDCSWRTCQNECSHHGLCNNGTCLCSPGYKGRDCSQLDAPVPCQCAIRCVRSCLEQCTQVHRDKGAHQSHTCYGKCTRSCVPQCAAGAEQVEMGSQVESATSMLRLSDPRALVLG